MADIIGTSGDDYLVGSNGDDTLDGAEGWDTAAFVLPAGTIGSLRLIEAPDGSLLVQLVQEDGSFEDVFSIAVSATGAATVTGLNSMAVLGTDTVSNVEDLHFYVDSGPDPIPEGQFLNVLLSPYVPQAPEFLHVSGSAADDSIDLAALYSELAPDTAVNANGGFGDDTISGNAGDNYVEGNSGNDTIDGRDGNDSLIGGDGDDNLIGGAGDDYLLGEAGGDSIDGGDGNDWIGGGGGDDSMSGGAGDDYFVGEGGSDSIDGGEGWDTTAFVLPAGTTGTLQVADNGDGTFTVQLIHEDESVEDIFSVTPGTSGNATVIGLNSMAELGTDTVTNVEDLHFYVDSGDQFVNVPLAPWVPLLDENNFAHVGGSAASDTIDLAALYPDSGPEVVVNTNGGGGNDSLSGTDGANWLGGDGGNDVLDGRGGNDSLVGGSGDDSLSGGAGDDYLIGEAGNDSIDGGDGFDIAAFVLPAGTSGTLQVVDNGDGTVTVQLVREDESVEDVFSVTPGTSGNATVIGLNSMAELGTDTVTNVEDLHFYVDSGDQFVNVPLAAVQYDGFVAGSSADDSIDLADYPGAIDSNGGLGDDAITGTDDANTIGGEQDNDSLYGLGGNDALYGGLGDDAVYGGDGDDLVVGNGGDDLLDGGAGSDIIYTGFGINSADGGDGYDQVFVQADVTLSDRIDVVGTGGNLSFSQGGVITNTVANAEEIQLRTTGSGGVLTIDASGYVSDSSAFLWLIDHDGTDLMIGSAGADGFGNIYTNVIGNDVFTGNGGADIFDYTFAVSGMNGDTITDFDLDDVIDLQFNDAANAAFTDGRLADRFIGGASFSGVAGEYRFSAHDGQTFVEADTDGDGAADQVLTLSNGEYALVETFAGSNILVRGADLSGGGSAIVGTDGNESIYGTLADDTIDAMGGNDAIYVSSGSDVICGGDGTFDRLILTASNADLMAAPAGSRTYVLTGSSIADSSGTIDTSFTGIEQVAIDTRGSGDFGDTVDASAFTSGLGSSVSIATGNGGDTIIGSNYDDRIDTGAGNDTVDGGAGYDAVVVRADNSAGGTISITGSDGSIQVTGNAGQTSTVLNAEEVRVSVSSYTTATTFDASGLVGFTGLLIIDDIDGSNVAIGSGGRELFANTTGFANGSDIFTGNGGADIFDYTVAISAMNGDVITDFDSDDIIDLQYNDIGWSAYTGGLVADTFIGNAEFSGTIGEYRYYVSAGQTVLEVDGDGDGLADHSLTLANGQYELVETYAGSNQLARGADLGATEGNDSLEGTDGDDVIDALGGDDSVSGLGGNDTLFGRAGNDILNGGGGDDRLSGGGGDDLLYGEGGNDTLLGGFGTNTLYGGDGYDLLAAFLDLGLSDTVQITGAGGDVTVSQGGVVTNQMFEGEELRVELGGVAGGPVTIDATGYLADGSAFLWLLDHDGTDIMLGSAGAEGFGNVDGNVSGNDIFTGNGGADIFDYTWAVSGMDGDTITDFDFDDVIDLRFNDAIENGSNYLADTFIGSAAFSGIAGEYRYSAHDGQTFVEVDTDGDALADEVLTLSNGEYALVETEAGSNILARANLVHGTDVRDIIDGTSDRDVIYGALGNDVIRGYEGDDALYGETGNDLLDGGAGNDILQGGDGNDVLSGRSGYNVLDGGDGDDSASAEADVAVGDTVVITGGGAHVTVSQGGAVTNEIYNSEEVLVRAAGTGGTLTFDASGYVSTAGSFLWMVDHDGTDIMIGSAGAEGFGNVTGNVTGNDIFTGNGGADIFDYTWAVAGMNGDTITDFDFDDTIDLRFNGSGELAGNGGYLADHFIGGAEFSGTAGEYRYAAHDGMTFVEADTDGDGVADQVLTLANGEYALVEIAAGSNILVKANAFTGTDGDEGLGGTDDRDVISGLGGNDSLYGAAGDDLISGGAGDDWLDGAIGNDTLDGGDGNDSFGGGEGDDSLRGGAGDDYLVGNSGDDMIDGGEGWDTAAFVLPVGTVGTLRVVPGSDGDILVQLVQADGSFEDVFSVVVTGTGQAVVTGLGTMSYLGSDSVSAVEDLHFYVDNYPNPIAEGQFANVLLDVAQFGDFLAGSAASDTIDLANFPGAVTADGGYGDDTIVGTDSAERLRGGAGDDTILGAGGDDRLYGDDGNDTLLGGAGNDLIFTGFGTTLVSGGDGYDTVYVQLDNSLSNTVYVTGTSGNVTVAQGGTVTNQVFDSEEVLVWSYGSVGTVTLDASGYVSTGDAILWLVDHDGSDVMIGSEGNDAFGNVSTNLTGADVFYGNGGYDLFDYTYAVGGMNNDTIMDFEFDETIDLRFNDSANQNYEGALLCDTFIGNAAFSGIAGEYRYTMHDGQTFVEADTDGDAIADQVLTIANGEFVLVETFEGSNILKQAASGVAVDGLIAGATVFMDMNGDGIWNEGEARTVTDSEGRFLFDVPSVGTLVVTGGTNVDTGLPNLVTMSAPLGSGVVNPLTTLVQALVESDPSLTPQEAAAAVAAALGISSSIDLLNTDVYSAAGTGDADALAAQKAAATVVALIVATEDAAGSGSGTQAIASLADLIGTGETIDLTDSTTIETVLTGIVDADDLDDVAGSVADSAEQISQADDLGELSQTQADALTRGNDLDNVLTGGTLGDNLVGLGGSDHLIGNAGDDVLEGGAGADVLDGGDGSDTADYGSSSAAVSINMVAGKAGKVSGGDATGDTLISIENATGSAFADKLVGDQGANVLNGGGGDDTINGGGGADTLWGGSGADVFVFKKADEVSNFDGSDVIMDFDAGGTSARSSIDMIDLSEIDANVFAKGNNAFAYIGDQAFTGAAGQLRMETQQSGAVAVMGDVNGDGAADFTLIVNLSGTLGASDFYL